ncbi:ribokinase [Mucilaginibacter sp. Bleaf8]|uniref:PfkB family carbohydrate kinase n=1 Tax=Mucilaginibacter sp. Bleaf8 TaxID=2834430 RepID=UPI001BCB0C89|nr:PfkB family carbohydrate kinase [Mucilaginibacter sp. Bleaf8]MBS7564475.1 ribokinase [Mucilaginibacter sp. Bleaf8]
MYDICCVGHITLDKVVNQTGEFHMAGGTAYYFANAVHNLPVNFSLVTAVGPTETTVVDQLKSQGIHIVLQPSTYSVYFENIYSGNQDHRTQRVLQKADPFTVSGLSNINARFFHLGPLLADDISLEMIQFLAGRGLVSLDVQGYLREVKEYQVVTTDWAFKRQALQHITILKANELELEALTGHTDMEAGARLLNQWGVKEVVITMGSKGSVIYTDSTLYTIPAYPPAVVKDATGCGDTYMAGYLYQRAKGADAEQAGNFAAAMASLKIEAAGPFTGSEADVLEVIARNKIQLP